MQPSYQAKVIDIRVNFNDLSLRSISAAINHDESLANNVESSVKVYVENVKA